MKNLASVVLLFSLFFACAHRAHAADAKNDPSQFPLAVHISAAVYEPGAGQLVYNLLYEIVTATVDGKHYQMVGPASSAKAFMHGNGLIDPGDYHAKLVKDEHKTSYESLQEFEILFPDGSTRRFDVIAQSE